MIKIPLVTADMAVNRQADLDGIHKFKMTNTWYMVPEGETILHL